MSLSFATLRKANTLRLPLFKNARGEPAHSEADGSDWSKGEWMNAILGELGEAANIVKKIKRGDFSLEQGSEQLAFELADVVTYTDITAMQMKTSFDIYADFNSFRQINEGIFDSDSAASLGEWMNKAFGAFGAAAMIVDEQARQEPENYRKTLGFYLLSGLVAIDCVAHKIDLNLGNAVLKKFNMVSARVKANVFINQQRDIVINYDGVELQ